MKLTYRDKMILLVVLVVIVWVVGIMMFIKPAYSDMKSENSTLETKKIELKNKKSQIDDDEKLTEEIKIAKKSASDIAKNFYNRLESDQVSRAVDRLLDGKTALGTDDTKIHGEILNDKLEISLVGSVVLERFSRLVIDNKTDIDVIVDGTRKTAEEQVEKLAEKLSTSVVIPNYQLTFGFTAKMADLQAFCDKLPSNDQKSLVITSCTIEDVTASEVKGTMSMNFMMMPRFEEDGDASKDDATKADETKTDE